MSLFDFDLTSDGERYMKQLEQLASLEVAVGFQEGQKYEDDTSLALIATYNEFGSSNTPARPFMKQSWERHSRQIQAFCSKEVKDISEGKSAQKALAEIGAYGKATVQQEIVDGEFAPNAPSTIKRKKSDRPLIDTGYMRQSVNFVVREKEDET